MPCSSHDGLYNGHKNWVPGQNCPALVKGGLQGGHSLNAAGLQFFGNCVTNMGKVSPELRQQLYKELVSGRRTAAAVDVVTLVSALGGVSSKTARSWRDTLHKRGWASAFQHGDVWVASASESFEVAVGTSNGGGIDEDMLLPDFVQPMNEEIAMRDRNQELDDYFGVLPTRVQTAWVLGATERAPELCYRDASS